MIETKLPLDNSGMNNKITITKIGSTPVTVKPGSLIPLTELVIWTYFTRRAARRSRDKSPVRWISEGFLKMGVMLGSEWCHNLAHLIASNLIGKPMDEFRIQFGMPRCIYYQLNDPDVTPRQHIIRSLGGPLVNLILVPITGLWSSLTRKHSLMGETAKTAFQTNLFLSLVSLLPIPGIDGGPILKWGLVDRGKSIEEADRVVRQVNGPLAVILGLFSSQAFLRKKYLSGFFSLMLGVISLGVFTGWLKEKDLPE
jgi:hypothetical protein